MASDGTWADTATSVTAVRPCRRATEFSVGSQQDLSEGGHNDAVTSHLLIVDDEDNLRTMLVAALSHHGFRVSSVANGRDALDAVTAARGDPLDLVVLDVMLPDLDGFEVCRRMRQAGNHTPVLFLTARDTTADAVRGLTLGGDDYMQKPFSLEELVARVTAVLRRAGQTRSETAVLSCADLTLDDDAHRVMRAGDDVSLSPTEYNLLRYLMLNQGRVVSKAQILDYVWHYDFGGNDGIVETYVGYVRRKLDNGPDGESRPDLIKTVRGVGYVLRPPT